jgi:hypothetical protein
MTAQSLLSLRAGKRRYNHVEPSENITLSLSFQTKRSVDLESDSSFHFVLIAATKNQILNLRCRYVQDDKGGAAIYFNTQPYNPLTDPQP